MINFKVLAISSLCLLLSQPAFSKGSPKVGKTLFNTCMACHGINASGNKVLNAPRLSGQYDWYLKRQLKNFKSGIRGKAKGDIRGAQMSPMSMTLANDKAIDDVISYIKTLKPKASKVTVKGDVKAGKISFGTCMACHGVKATGNKALNAPNLTVLPDWYIVNQLKGFKSGYRGVHKKDIYGAQMRPMAMILADDKSINNVAAYIKSISK